MGRIVQKVEDLLIESGKFRVPSGAAVVSARMELESSGRRGGRDGNRTTQKKQKRYDSGKQKCHTLKGRRNC